MHLKNPNNKIPDPIYYELVELFGVDKANEIVENEEIDFRYLTMFIQKERIKRRFGVKVNIWLVAIIILMLYLIYSYFK